jgi:hypothetical protein
MSQLLIVANGDAAAALCLGRVPSRNGKGMKAEQSLALQPGNDPMPNATLAKHMTS